MPGHEAPSPTVLLVGVSAESLLVLGESFARQGLDITQAGSTVSACERIERGETRVTVLDADALTATEIHLLSRAACRSGALIVLVGTNRPDSVAAGAVFLRKPYHYRELVHKIGASLGNVGTQARAAA